MRLIKPDWLHHDGGGIYSLDVHPTDNKLVTGGTDGRDGGQIIIWDTRPVISERHSNDTTIPKQLCSLEQYSCVNVVRWSVNGRWLASAGDDSIVYIWHYVGRNVGGGSLGSDKPPNIDVWKQLYLLKGHNGDILHIEWSPDEKYLASCSVDNQVIVWNAHKLPEKVVTLSDHTDFVKGVSWDPVGKYLASQSCDKSVRIYATSTWQCVKTIKEPFQESGNTTHALRLCWSTDGSTLVAAHAMNNGGPTAQIINRQTWDTNKDLVGHRKAVSCVRFSPVMYERKKKKHSHKTDVGCLLALGSRDKALSVWQHFFTRPIVTCSDLFNQGIIDLSWGSDGLTLFCCSIDGSVACAAFDIKELGRPLTKTEMADHMCSKYGKSIRKLNSCQNGHDDSFIANPLVLQAQMVSKEKERTQLKAVTQPPKELPKELPTAADIPVAVVQNGASHVTPSKEPAKPAEQQKMTVTPGGKKRITPIFLGSCTQTVVPPPLISEVRAPSPTIVPPPSSPVQEEKRKNKHKRHRDKNAASSSSTAAIKRKASSPTIDSPTKKKGRAKLGVQLEAGVAAIADSTEDENTDVHLVYNNTTVQLEAPAPNNTLTVTVENVESGLGPLSFVVENRERIAGTNVTVGKLMCMQAGSAIWHTFLSAPVIVVAASSGLVVCGCADRSVQMYSSKSGRLLSPSLVLDASPVLISANLYFVVVLTSDATVYAWNVEDRRSLMTREPLHFLVSENETVSVTSLNITDNGSVVVQLSDSRTYTYCSSWKVWSLISNENDVLYRMSMVQPSSKASKALQIDGPVSEYASSDKNVGNGPIQCPVNMQQTASCILLEKRLQACSDLKSTHEYTLNMHEYVKMLANCDDKAKIREVFEELVEDDHSKELLNDLLLVAARNSALGWLCAEFSERNKMKDVDII